MHIPDGFVNMPVAAVTALGSAAAVAYGSSKLGKALPPEKAPILGIAGAFVFAAQMVNFPVAGGTSGHLIGAAVVTALLGPWAAVLVMTAVLILQCLVFQDGGLTALGANVFNMALVATFTAYGIRLLAKNAKSLSVRYGLVALGAWASVLAASVACSLELAISGTTPLGIVLPAMGSVHAVIGVGEALITVGALAVVNAARPDLWPATSKAEVA